MNFMRFVILACVFLMFTSQALGSRHGVRYFLRNNALVEKLSRTYGILPTKINHKNIGRFVRGERVAAKARNLLIAGTFAIMLVAPNAIQAEEGSVVEKVDTTKETADAKDGSVVEKVDTTKETADTKDVSTVEKVDTTKENTDTKDSFNKKIDAEFDARIDHLFKAQDDFHNLLYKIREMRAYDPDFTATVAAGEKKLQRMLQAQRHLWELEGFDERDTPYLAKDLTNKLQKDFKNLTKGIQALVRDSITWTVKDTSIGLDYRDIDKYYAVRDTLTAVDYDGVKVHYFVDGKSYRGVAKYVHPEMKMNVRIDGQMIIDVAQISGVLITYRAPSIEQEYHQMVDSSKFIEPHDVRRYVVSHHLGGDIRAKVKVPPKLTRPWELPYEERDPYILRRRDAIYKRDKQRDFFNGAQVNLRSRMNGRVYSSGYAEAEVTNGYIEDIEPVIHRDRYLNSGAFIALLKYTDHPHPETSVSVTGNLVLDTFANDTFNLAYGDNISVRGLSDLYLRHYREAKDSLTAHNYYGGLVRYRDEDGGLYTGLVVKGDFNSPRAMKYHFRNREFTRMIESNDEKVAVINLATGKKNEIVVSDIQGLLQVDYTDYGRSATVNIDGITYYGKVFLAFTTDELSVLAYAKRRGKGKLELLNDEHTIITMPQKDGDLTLH